MDYEGRGLSSDIFPALGVRAIVFLYELPVYAHLCVERAGKKERGTLP